VIGLDTNVLARYIVQDHPEQSAAVARLIEGQCTAAREPIPSIAGQPEASISRSCAESKRAGKDQFS